MSEDHTPIYTRLVNLEKDGARMDERMKAFEASHTDIKKGLRAVEGKVESLFIKIGVLFFISSAVFGAVLKFVK